MKVLRRILGPPPIPFRVPVSIAPPSERPERFNVVGSATSSGTGDATITLAGPPRRERWDLEVVAIDSPAGTAEVFRNAETAGNLIAAAPASPNVLDRNNPHVLAPGERVVIVFAGAGAGVVCTARMEGRRRAVG